MTHKTKHTQGPWEISFTGVWSNDARICDYRDNGYKDLYRQLSEEEQEANAHLIAASPDMKKELMNYEGAVYGLLNDQLSEIGFVNLCKEIYRNRAAITKATGAAE